MYVFMYHTYVCLYHTYVCIYVCITYTYVRVGKAAASSLGARGELQEDAGGQQRLAGLKALLSSSVAAGAGGDSMVAAGGLQADGVSSDALAPLLQVSLDDRA